MKNKAKKHFLSVNPRSRSSIKWWKRFLSRKNNWIREYSLDMKKLNNMLMLVFDDLLTCKYCNEKLTIENISLDHIIPIKRGGSINSFDNLDFICIKCNKRKDILTDEEYLGLLKYLDTISCEGKSYVLKQLSKNSMQFYKKKNNHTSQIKGEK